MGGVRLGRRRMTGRKGSEMGGGLHGLGGTEGGPRKVLGVGSEGLGQGTCTGPIRKTLN